MGLPICEVNILVKQSSAYQASKETCQSRSGAVLLIVDYHLLWTLLYDARVSTSTIFTTGTATYGCTAVGAIGYRHLPCRLGIRGRTPTIRASCLAAIVWAAAFRTYYLHIINLGGFYKLANVIFHLFFMVGIFRTHL